MNIETYIKLLYDNNQLAPNTDINTFSNSLSHEDLHSTLRTITFQISNSLGRIETLKTKKIALVIDGDNNFRAYTYDGIEPNGTLKYDTRGSWSIVGILPWESNEPIETYYARLFNSTYEGVEFVSVDNTNEVVIDGDTRVESYTIHEDNITRARRLEDELRRAFLTSNSECTVDSRAVVRYIEGAMQDNVGWWVPNDGGGGHFE